MVAVKSRVGHRLVFHIVFGGNGWGVTVSPRFWRRAKASLFLSCFSTVGLYRTALHDNRAMRTEVARRACQSLPAPAPDPARLLAVVRRWAGRGLGIP